MHLCVGGSGSKRGACLRVKKPLQSVYVAQHPGQCCSMLQCGQHSSNSTWHCYQLAQYSQVTAAASPAEIKLVAHTSSQTYSTCFCQKADKQGWGLKSVACTPCKIQQAAANEAVEEGICCRDWCLPLEQYSPLGQGWGSWGVQHPLPGSLPLLSNPCQILATCIGQNSTCFIAGLR